MILGIGNDICDIRRIERAVERFGDRFVRRCFTEVEVAKAERRRGAGMPVYAGTLAKRFAAKEACAKALGTGFRRGVFLRDIGVVNQSTGQPTLKLTGGALERLQTMAPAATVHLTMTDEYPYAEAMVIIATSK